MASKQPANKNDAEAAAPSAPKVKGNPYFPQAANQVGMSIALLAVMVLNVPIFQRASDEKQMGMVIFEVILMFLCTASCGMLAMSGVRNLGRGFAEELRRQLSKADAEG